MQKNILEYLEKTTATKSEKMAYANQDSELSFQQVYEGARSIGTHLIKQGHKKEPIVIFMGKSPQAIVGFYGVIYSGNYYVPIDEEMPKQRIELIFKSLRPRAVICDKKTKKSLENMEGLEYKGATYLYNEVSKAPVNNFEIDRIRDSQIDTDPIYVIFTSGSTGVPKGVIANHRGVIDYIESLSQVLEFNEDTVFGNQTPLYVDACLKELIPTMKFGASTYLIPKSYFMFPLKLVEYLNEKKINTVCWVVSALTMISALGTFEKAIPKYLHTIAFGSEVFPIKEFNKWKQFIPHAKYVNLYGPTEATGMSSYYEVNRDFELDELIPIGRPFNNTDIILIKEGKEVTQEEELGEIYIRGTCLTLGYYKDSERTDEVFVQNPLHNLYPELIYCTGDLAKYNKYGELVFVSRKDNQIKHMGHRIELGEIEMAIQAMEAIKSAACLFDEDKKKIILYYVGDLTSADVVKYLRGKIPRYMIPNTIIQIGAMPLTNNGKTDRMKLKKQYKDK